MLLDAKVAGAGCKGATISTARHLCRSQLDQFRRAATDGTLTVACTQERALFEEVAEDENLGATLTFVNVRETAGWSSEGKTAAAKMAALIAVAAETPEPYPIVSFESEGVTLIYGRDQTAIDAALQLKDKLDITVILMPGSDVAPPHNAEFPVRQGRVKTATGYLGAFEITLDAFAAPAASSRAKLAFGKGQDGAVSKADVFIDLSGGKPLFNAADLREGYLKADPANAVEVQKLLFKAADLVGTFDKPRYIDFHDKLCAHSRSKKVGCTRCLDLCPAGAITPHGDRVAIDPYICGGCGQCAAACPTGAASYAMPPADALMRRLRALLTSYRAAGGQRAQVLIHDGDHGDALIDAAARFGDGLPARTLPLAVNEVTQVGLEVIAAAFAYGAASVQLLTRAKPKHDIAGLRQTIETANTLLVALGYGDSLVGTIETDDPDQMIAALRAAKDGTVTPRPASFLATGAKRDVLKMALRELHRAAPQPAQTVALPKGAVFGTVNIKTEGCTLCLSCVSACPTHALGDAQDRPLLTFDESLCVQCGLCQATCPEKVISLEPRLDFAAFEAGAKTVKEEEPFCCISCGKAFGVKSTVEKIAAKLEGRHWMFTGENKARVDLIKMCENCRVEKVINAGLDPFAGPARPAARTSEDYFREREAKEQEIKERERAMLDKIERGEV
jgi:ferredoxin/nucleotide-binding universal stress UspA family protein